MRIGRDAGFTLLEIVLALALVGSLASFVAPSIADTFSRRAVRDARDTFVAKHGLARSAAIREGWIGELHVDAAAGRVWLEVDTSVSGAGIMDTVGMVADFSDQGVLVATNHAVVCFDGRGLVTEAGTCEQADISVVFVRGIYADTVHASSVGRLLP